ncbi:MAG TPA: hypothetical protein VF665_06535 [Longimicrobium sp.]|jgi:DNA-directed RNA polymerase subunit RPC12/RpoP|uniref:hypothetical protein n=1 Tax=Longimicrobium sp. TaxID=2029185 RepID=UPI002ED9D05F
MLVLVPGFAAIIPVSNALQTGVGPPFRSTRMVLLVLVVLASLGTSIWRGSNRRFRLLGLACASCGTPLIDFQRMLALNGSSCRRCGAEVFVESAEERTRAATLPTLAEVEARFRDAHRLPRREQGFVLACVATVVAGLVQASRTPESSIPAWVMAAFVIGILAAANVLDWLRGRRMRALGLWCATCDRALGSFSRAPDEATMRARACWYCAARVIRSDAPPSSSAGSSRGR